MSLSDEEILSVLRLQWHVWGPSSAGRWSAVPRRPGRSGETQASSVEELAIKLRYAQHGPAWWPDYNLPGGCDDLSVAAKVTGHPNSYGPGPGYDEGVCLVLSRAGWCYVRPREADGSWGLCAPSSAELGDWIEQAQVQPGGNQ